MYDEIYPEVKYGEENSRIDFLLKGGGLPDCYVEVKSITFVKGTLGDVSRCGNYSWTKTCSRAF